MKFHHRRVNLFRLQLRKNTAAPDQDKNKEHFQVMELKIHEFFPLNRQLSQMMGQLISRS